MAAHFSCSLVSNLFLLILLSPLITATPAPQQELASKYESSWQKYVRAPTSKSVLPARVLDQYTAGNVENPDGFVVHNGLTVLTRQDQDEDEPTIVVDFGQTFAGLLSIEFDGAEAYGTDNDSTGGLPGLTLAFSETLEGLTDRSDFTRSDNAAGVSSFTPGILIRDPFLCNNRPRRSLKALIR